MLQSAEFWVAVAFVIFVVAVFKKIRTTLNTALDDRAGRIRAEIEEAEGLREEAQHLLAEYQRKQRQAQKEAEQILAHAQVEAERGRTQAAAELAAKLARRERQAMDRIALAEADAVAEVRRQAAELAIAATRRLLVDQLDPAKADALIDAAIADLPRRVH